MPRQAPVCQLTVAEHHQLHRLVNARSTPQALAFRARLVLRCADADSPTNFQVARELDCDTDTVGKWRSRFVRLRLDGLQDLPRPGRPRTFSPGGPPQSRGLGHYQTARRGHAGLALVVG